MREMVSRLRAALSPYALAIFSVLLVLLAMMARGNAPLDLEKRIARTLSLVEGAGRVEVTIRMREAESGGSLGLAKKTESIPCGAVAVAQGADDPFVAMQLNEALCSLLGLAPSAVSVIAGGR